MKSLVVLFAVFLIQNALCQDILGGPRFMGPQFVDQEAIQQALIQQIQEQAEQIAVQQEQLIDQQEEDDVFNAADDMSMDQFMLQYPQLFNETEPEIDIDITSPIITERQVDESFEVSRTIPERLVRCRSRGCLDGIQVSERHDRRMITYTFRHNRADCRVGSWAIDLGTCSPRDVRVVGCTRRTGEAWTCSRISSFRNRFVVDLSTCDSVTLIFSRDVSWERQNMLLQSRERRPDCAECQDIIVPVCRREDRPVCGNNRVERGEECDPPGDCCTRNCKFASTDRTCRPRRGKCDIPETCTGRSDQCPRDRWLPRGSFCNCDNRRRGECTGNSRWCHTREGRRCEM